jgi:hypothetical protein
MICILQYYHIINSSCFVLLSCRASDDSAKQQSLAVFSAKPYTKNKGRNPGLPLLSVHVSAHLPARHERRQPRLCTHSTRRPSTTLPVDGVMHGEVRTPASWGKEDEKLWFV